MGAVTTPTPTPAPMPSSLRVVSYGGGIQSTALLVLAASGRIDYPVFLMANVGDDSEDPRTLSYVREVAQPYAAAHGIELTILNRVKRDGATETLWQRLMRPESRSLSIPVRMSNGAPGNRTCTVDFKLKVIGKELKRRGATKDNPATLAVGISRDEITRANNRRAEPYEHLTYPLVSIGDDTGLNLNRAGCARIITNAGLPVPPKSSCFFCPFHRPAAWADLRRERPDLFDKACQLEEVLNQRRAALGKDQVWLTRFGLPLREAIHQEDLLPFDETAGECDSGWCWT